VESTDTQAKQEPGGIDEKPQNDKEENIVEAGRFGNYA